MNLEQFIKWCEQHKVPPDAELKGVDLSLLYAVEYQNGVIILSDQV